MVKGLPSRSDMMWPTLLALKELGGSGTNAEIFSFLTHYYKFSDNELKILSGNTDTPYLYLPWLANWAKSTLRGKGFINNTQRGLWVLTLLGEQTVLAGEAEFKKLEKSIVYQPKHQNKTSHISNSGIEPQTDASSESEDWQDTLIGYLYEINPYDFEKLCQRLLREAGFKAVRVTSKSGDGGMDGYGTLSMGLVTFKVAFQAKRYKGSVGAPDVQKVRGALNSRTECAEKGLIITTGTFTQQAREEAAELPTVDLIDGEALCHLCKQYGLGVETQMVEQVTVHKIFFDNLS